MAHRIFVKDVATGQCGLADPVCPVSGDPGNLVRAGTDGGPYLSCADVAACGFVTSSGVTGIDSSTIGLAVTNPAGPVVTLGLDPLTIIGNAAWPDFGALQCT